MSTDEIDFSLLSMFTESSWLVQLVFIVLTMASVGVWAVIIDRIIAFERAKTHRKRFEKLFWSKKPLEDLLDKIGKPKTANQKLFVTGMREWRRSLTDDGNMIEGGVERAERAMRVTLAREAERLETGFSFLATVSVCAPFVGLLGTVWGIKDSFQDIAISQSASLAVVAPGIAEALLATSFGLIAAIPATAAYNYMLTVANRRIAELENFVEDFSAILSRQFSRKLDGND